MQGYITLNMTEVGFGTFETNLLTVPAFVLFIIGLLFWTWLSEKLNERFLLACASQIWVLPGLIALISLGTDRSPWANYALSIVTYGMCSRKVRRMRSLTIYRHAIFPCGLRCDHFEKCWKCPNENCRFGVVCKFNGQNTLR